MTFSNTNPFNGPVPETVPLPRTPLTGVLVQVRFNEILSIDTKRDLVASFQEEIRDQYPVSLHQQDQVLEITPNGPRPKNVSNWRFLDAKQEWRVSLTTNFLAIEARRYDSRADLTERVGLVVQALAKTVKPNLLNRIGVRYVDRVFGAELDYLEKLIRPEVLGVYVKPLNGSIRHMINEMSAKAAEGVLSSRWGHMPANATHDTELMPPITTPSWFLDIDVYQQFRQPEEFGAGDVRKRVMDLATRAYGFFRWAVSEEFLKTYGGKI